MSKIISTPLPKDLPENWNDTQFVSPGGTEVGLTAQHGYNYLMKQVNAAQKAAEELETALEYMAKTNITQGVNFDNLTSSGVYLCSSGAVVQACTNYPSGMPIGEFRLDVQELVPGSYVIHRLSAKSGATVRDYIRTMSAGVWAPWSLDSALYGLVEDILTQVSSPEDLDTRLNNILAGMPTGKTRFIYVHFNPAHPVIGGADRIFKIDKLTTNYAVIHTLGYTNDAGGAVSEYVRSQYGGVWSSWARNYNTMFKPTFSDVGAEPAGLVTTTVEAGTNAAIESALTTWIAAMPANKIRHFIMSVSATNLNLGGGVWFITINKTSSLYASITATKHHTSGAYIKVCSLNEGALTGWVNITPSAVAPASVE